MWERRDLKLVGVLALREIILALDRERASLEADRAKGKVKPELTAGNVCRQDCVTVKVGLMCQCCCCCCSWWCGICGGDGPIFHIEKRAL